MTPLRTTTRSPALTVSMLTVLLTCSAGLNLLLSHELQSSRKRPSSTLKTGTQVPPLEGRTVDGEPLTITFDQGIPTMLYYFSAECGWCERNWPNIDAVRTGTQGRYRIVGVAASAKVPAYMQDPTRPLTIVTGLAEATRKAYGFSGTPHAVVVGPDGRVITSWVGAWADTEITAASALFGVAMPGLSPKRPRP